MIKVEKSEKNRVKNSGSESMHVIVLMKNVILILFFLMIIQFWLGMTINLEVNMPVKHLGIIESLLYYGGNYGFIAAHVANGIILLTFSLVFLLISLRSSYTSLKIGSAVTLASVVGAVVNGVLFLESGQSFGWSIGMAMSAVGVLVSAAASLYFVGKNLARVEALTG